MENEHDNNKNYRLNRKYSTTFLAITVLFSIAGISLRIAYDATSLNMNNSQSAYIEVANEEEVSPSVILTPPDELKDRSGSGSELSGSGSQIKEIETGSGSALDEVVEYDFDVAVDCGAVDNDRNGKVDMADFIKFKDVYLKSCSDDEVQYLDSCGSNDFNQNNRISIEDFVNFIEKYEKGECTEN